MVWQTWPLFFFFFFYFYFTLLLLFWGGKDKLIVAVNVFDSIVNIDTLLNFAATKSKSLTVQPLYAKIACQILVSFTWVTGNWSVCCVLALVFSTRHLTTWMVPEHPGTLKWQWASGIGTQLSCPFFHSIILKFNAFNAFICLHTYLYHSVHSGLANLMDTIVACMT